MKTIFENFLVGVSGEFFPSGFSILRASAKGRNPTQTCPSTSPSSARIRAAQQECKLGAQGLDAGVPGDRSSSLGWFETGDNFPSHPHKRPVILTVGAFQPEGRTCFCLCFCRCLCSCRCLSPAQRRCGIPCGDCCAWMGLPDSGYPRSPKPGDLGHPVLWGCWQKAKTRNKGRSRSFPPAEKRLRSG